MDLLEDDRIPVLNSELLEVGFSLLNGSVERGNSLALIEHYN